MDKRKLEIHSILEPLMHLNERSVYEEVEFPVSLTAFDRKAIYDVCEENKLESEKIVDEETKFLRVRS